MPSTLPAGVQRGIGEGTGQRKVGNVGPPQGDTSGHCRDAWSRLASSSAVSVMLSDLTDALELRDAEVRDPDVANLALALHLGQRSD